MKWVSFETQLFEFSDLTRLATQFGWRGSLQHCCIESFSEEILKTGLYLQHDKNPIHHFFLNMV